MKVIHRSEFRNTLGFVSPGNALRATVKRGSQWQRELAGEDRVGAALGKALDDRHFLIRNLVLPSDKFDLDMVLVGPTGMWEFEVLHFTGLVNTDNGWMCWDFTQGGVRPIPREIAERAQGKAAHLTTFLAEQGLPGIEVNQAVILSTPNAPREFSIAGMQVIFIEELGGFIQTAMELLKPEQPLPVDQIVALLSRVQGRETAQYVPEKVMGMTPVQFYIVLTLGVGVVCVVLAFLVALLFYEF